MFRHIILILSTILLLTACYKPEPFDEAGWRREIASADTSTLLKNNFDGEKYFNPWLQMEKKGLFTMFKWWLAEKADYSIGKQDCLPQVVPLTADSIRKLGNDDFFVWLGHYSYLFRIDGKYLLVDPQLSKRIYTVRRLVELPVTAEELSLLTPDLLTLITHSHYDHLDVSTLEKLPDSTVFMVPRGVKELLPDKFLPQTTEYNWWQNRKISDSLSVVMLPAQHWSNRLWQSANSALWCGYLLVTPKYKIYLSGDTGYFFGFKKFKEKFGVIDYAFLPVGPSDPRWLMHYQHVNLQEALEGFTDLGAKQFVPGHWGTFNLGDDPPGLPGRMLKDSLRVGRLDSNRVVLPVIGKIYQIESRGAK